MGPNSIVLHGGGGVKKCLMKMDETMWLFFMEEKVEARFGFYKLKWYWGGNGERCILNSAMINVCISKFLFKEEKTIWGLYVPLKNKIFLALKKANAHNCSKQLFVDCKNFCVIKVSLHVGIIK